MTRGAGVLPFAVVGARGTAGVALVDARGVRAEVSR